MLSFLQRDALDDDWRGERVADELVFDAPAADVGVVLLRRILTPKRFVIVVCDDSDVVIPSANNRKAEGITTSLSSQTTMS